MGRNCGLSCSKNMTDLEILQWPITMSSRGISASFGKPSLKNSKNFRIISSNQKLVRALTSTPKAVTRTNTSCCLATSGTKTAGSITSRRSDVAIKWHLFPRLMSIHCSTNTWSEQRKSTWNCRSVESNLQKEDWKHLNGNQLEV